MEPTHVEGKADKSEMDTCTTVVTGINNHKITEVLYNTHTLLFNVSRVLARYVFHMLSSLPPEFGSTRPQWQPCFDKCYLRFDALRGQAL